MTEPYYADDAATLYHGDCLDILPALGGVDLIVTSPPYNLGVTTGGGFGHYKDGQRHGGQGKWGGTGRDGITYADHADTMPYPEYREWQRSVLTACWRTLTNAGAIFYNHKPRVQAGTLWLPLDLNPDLPLRQIIIWARSGGMNYAPTHYVPTHEWICIFAKPAWRLKSKAASGTGDVWRIPQESNASHPAPFPLSLPAAAIESTSPTLVLDPMAGSGTTLRAAKAAGVRSVGVEISERYCEVAAEYLAQGVLAFEAAL
jgi:site-specific DNA-methyltransferase (adenine-specific)